MRERRAGLLLRLASAILISIGTLTAASAESDGGFDYKAFHANRFGAVPGAAAAGAASRAPAAREARESTVLMVSGVIGPGAHRRFQAALYRANPTLVVLDSPGGVLGEAIMIAEEIRRRGLSTLVTANRSCASACAIVFLSGRVKYMGDGAAIGLHSASFADGRTDPEATEIMAAYLRQLGVPQSTLIRMARTAPSDIRWLTRTEQQAIGIRPYN
jgi:hypothetical protein